jgi:hypothetical protein
MLYFGKQSNTSASFSYKLSFESPRLSSVGACAFRTIITPATSQHSIWHCITNKVYSLNCRYVPVMYVQGILSLADGFVSVATHTKPHSSARSESPLSNLTSCTHIESNLYSTSSFTTVFSDPYLRRPFTFPVPNLKSLFHCLSHYKDLSKSGATCNIFYHYTFYGECLLPSSNSQAGGPPLVGCLPLLIQYIRSYLLYMHAVFTIRNLRTHRA